MKKLHLLKPNYQKGFLDNGSGEKVEYLKVPEDLTIEALEEDVDAGALAFKEILEGAKKGLSRVIMVRSKSKENALMAVNYLAGICNQLNDEKEDEFDNFENSISDEYNVEELLDEYDIDYDEIYGSDDEDDGNISHWSESPHRLPIIHMEQILRHTGEFEEFHGPNFMSVGLPNVRNKKPYWMQCTEEAICILTHNNGFGFDFFGRLSMAMDRFLNNKHVFVVVLEEQYPWGNEDDEAPKYDYFEQSSLEFVLENTADLFYANAKEADLKEYRVTLFENWIEEMDITLEKRFPKVEITEKIIALKNANKSMMMEKVLKYVVKESHKKYDEEITKEDFAVLKKFKALGMEDKEKSNTKRFENELVGMEDVKEQVRNIVNVMKYNKYREKMGIGKACFHNAHLLIGAPGTAKTTVAQFMGTMMFEENLLPGNRFIAVNGADLKGIYVGHSAPKTHQIFENHDVILIDEAYSLTAKDGEGMDTFSQEALAQLILEIENHPMDKLVMFAGYGGINVSEKNNKMKQFIDANPGLKSRINSTIYFDSYTPDQMVDIVHVQAKMQKFVVDKEADGCIREYFEERTKDQNFGNGREARSLLENAIVFSASRVMKLSERKRTKKAMTQIKVEDIKNAIAHMKESDRMQRGKQRGKTGFNTTVTQS